MLCNVFVLSVGWWHIVAIQAFREKAYGIIYTHRGLYDAAS